MRRLLLMAVLLFSGIAIGQSAVIPFPGVPSGACPSTKLALDLSNGHLYSCNNGTWLEVGPGAAGSAAFNTITSGTNTGAAMVVGTGASLSPTGTGTIRATGASTSPILCGAGSYATGINSDFSAAGCATPTLTAPFITSSANPAASGVLRCSNSDVCLGIRNGTNTGDYTLTADSTGFILSAPLKINSTGASNYTAISDPGSPASGDFWYSSTTGGRFKWYDGSATRTFMNTADSVLAAQMPALTGDVTTSAGAVATTLGANFKRRGIAFEIGDPGGSALTAATTTTAYVTVPFQCTLSAWNLLVDAGTITVKFWKVATGTAIPTSTNSINTSGVSISTGTAIHSTTMTDFTTTAVSQNDIIAMNVTATATAKYVSGVLECDQ